MDLPLFGSDDPALATAIGLEAARGEFITLLESGETLPASTTKVFTTYEDDQTAVEVRLRAADEDGVTKLDDVVFDGIPPVPAETASIEVEVAVDQSGYLRMLATEDELDYEATYGIELGEEYVE